MVCTPKVLRELAARVDQLPSVVSRWPGADRRSSLGTSGAVSRSSSRAARTTFRGSGGEVAVRTLGGGDRHRLDDRVEPLGNELLALFARLPDVEDAEDASVMVEASRMNQETVRGVLKIERRSDGVVVLGTVSPSWISNSWKNVIATLCSSRSVLVDRMECPRSGFRSARFDSVSRVRGNGQAPDPSRVPTSGDLPSATPTHPPRSTVHQ